MNIDINDEMIEKMLEGQIKAKIDNWFMKQGSVANVLKGCIHDVVMKELSGFEYEDVIREEARALINKDVMDRVCNRISDDIARAFADKYGEY